MKLSAMGSEEVASPVEEAVPGAPDTIAAPAMGERVQAHDWLDMIISSRQPMFIAWGPELTFLYNDAYAEILGNKHPAALGRSFQQVWPDVWDAVEPLVDRALAGEATWSENLPLTMERKGFREDTWWTFSYSPLRDDEKRIAGMFCSCMETTGQVLAERRSTAERERLFEMSRDLFGVATFDGYLRTVNPAWSRVLGRSDEADLLKRAPQVRI